MKELVFKLAELPPGLNKIKDLAYNEEYGEERDRWHLLVRKAIGRNLVSFPGRVSIDYTRRSVGCMDVDNREASFKLIGDALKNLHVIKDDSPEYIDEKLSHYNIIRVPHYRDQGIEVMIKDLGPLTNAPTVVCSWCGDTIDTSKPYRRTARKSEPVCNKCALGVNHALKLKGLGQTGLIVVKPPKGASS